MGNFFRKNRQKIQNHEKCIKNQIFLDLFTPNGWAWFKSLKYVKKIHKTTNLKDFEPIFSKIEVFSELLGQSPPRHPIKKMVDIISKFIKTCILLLALYILKAVE